MDKFLNVSNLFWRAFKFMARKGMMNWMPDKLYLNLMFRAVTGKKLNLHNPRKFNEKLQWMKLYDRNPLYTMMVDKVKAKEYVAEKIGKQYIIPTLGVWESADDVDFNSLPDRFVIKCNHNSGKGMYICKDKSKMNEAQVREGLRQGLKENYYKHGREWPYRDVPRRILAEQYMENDCETVMDAVAENKAAHVGDLRDYKFFCFNGEPRLCEVISDRAVDERIDFYDLKWNRIAGLIDDNVVCNSVCDIPRPQSLEDMCYCARVLSANIPFSRIDFYDINGRAYWGEITFFPSSGFDTFKPDEWNDIIGDWLRLPLKK